MNIPNKLTVSRMLLTPLFLALIMADIKHNFWLSLVVFAVAALTDFADGKLARKYDEVTVFGQLVDPVADKMLTTAALLSFLHYGLCNVWIVLIILTREFAVTSIRLIASAQDIVIPANIWGKLKTVCQMVFSLLIIFLAGLDSNYTVFKEYTPISLAFLSHILLWITAILAVVSGLVYALQSKNYIDYSK